MTVALRSLRVRASVVLVAMAAGPLAAGVALAHPGSSVCLVRQFTGWTCPFCGGTHAVAALGQGNLARALSYDALVVFMAAAAVIMAVVVLASGQLPGSMYVKKHWRASVVATAVILGLFMVVRNLPGSPLAVPA